MANGKQIADRRDAIVEVLAADEYSKSIEDIACKIRNHATMIVLTSLRENPDSIKNRAAGIIKREIARKDKKQADASLKDGVRRASKKKKATTAPNLDASLIRTIQRDLLELEKEGRVISTAPNALAGERKQLWTAAPVLTTQIDSIDLVDQLITFSALRVFRDLLEPAFPLKMQEDLLKVYAAAEALDKPGDIQDDRWVNALRLRTPYHYFSSPQISGDVRDEIERAVLTRKKIRLTVQVGDFGPWPEGEAVVSISHFVLTLPDKPAVVVWRDDEVGHVRARGLSNEYVIALETIVTAVVIDDENAHWPDGYEPRNIRAPQRTLVPNESWETIEFRASPYIMEFWIGTWIDYQLWPRDVGTQRTSSVPLIESRSISQIAAGVCRNSGIIGIDDEGWSVCRITCPKANVSEWGEEGDDFLEYLSRYSEDVEILAPYVARCRIQARASRLLLRYENCQPMPQEIADKRWEEDSA